MEEKENKKPQNYLKYAVPIAGMVIGGVVVYYGVQEIGSIIGVSDLGPVKDGLFAGWQSKGLVTAGGGALS